MKKLRKVKAIEIKAGETVYNLAASAANDDWIRAGRLLTEGKVDEVKALDAEPMYYRPESLIRHVKKKGKRKD